MIEKGDILGGKYRVTSVLGAGGMGLVFEALHEELGKRVAIKSLHDQFEDNEETLARFVQEARAAASIGHRSIVDIYDVGVHQDSTFIVMEHLTGETLGDRIDDAGQLETDESIHVVCHVLSALEAAHARGIVHRDLKPENIFLVDSGQIMPDVKLLDFGISKILDPSQQSELVTSTGVVLGTPQYMAPEQAMGRKDVDHQADLYATGVILYQCLTGALPHSGENPMALLHSIITEPYVKPRTICPNIADELERILIKSLEKDREERYPSATEMLTELYEFLDEGSRSQVPIPSGLRIASGSSAPSAPSRSAPEGMGFESTVSPAGEEKSIPPADIDGSAAGVEPSTSKPNASFTWSHTFRGRAGHRRRLLGAALVLILAAAGAVAIVVSRDTTPTTHVLSASSLPDVSEEDSGPLMAGMVVSDSSPRGDGQVQEEEQVVISLEAVPEDAVVTVNGTETEGPTITMLRSQEPRELRVALPDGRSWEHQIVPDQNRILAVSFENGRSTSRPSVRRNKTTPQGDPPPAREERPGPSSTQASDRSDADPRSIFNNTFN